ncbi:hypothetical protein MJN47_31280, partial [Salmonella enterica subsp. enterica serovar Lubbock]|nr:hypothetical protein [Salmonella enterica subsp. enterica serovar Lubbock]
HKSISSTEVYTKVFALDVAARHRVQFSMPESDAVTMLKNRHASYHEAKADTASPEVIADCPRRIILPVNDGRLFAVNAETGKLC